MSNIAKAENIVATQSSYKACADCGYIHELPSVKAGSQVECGRCGSSLYKERRQWVDRSVALSLTGLVLFVVANVYPFIGLEAAGLTVDSNLISGVYALIQRERWLLAAMIFLFIFLIPFIEICCLSYLAISFRFFKHKRPRWIAKIMRAILIIHPWSMMEIFLLGVLVTSIKLGDMATLVPGAGSIAFVLLVLVLVALHLQLSHDRIWQWWQPENLYRTKEDLSLNLTPDTDPRQFVSCHCCHALVSHSVTDINKHCPRCGDELHFRTPNSLEKSFALLLAGVVLYLPANLLPIMTTTQLGQTQSDTIMSGVLHLIHLGSWPIALVVFIASVVVPIAKIVVMAYLLHSARYGIQGKTKKRTAMYRLTEFIGRWSMVDVFVVCLLVAMVQFGLLANIEPSSATLAFAAVVILTMLAAEVFDQRLLWDENDEQRR